MLVQGQRVFLTFEELQVLITELSTEYIVNVNDSDFATQRDSFLSVVGLEYSNRQIKPLRVGIMNTSSLDAEAIGFQLGEEETPEHVEKSIELEESMKENIFRLQRTTLSKNNSINDYYESIDSNLRSNWEIFYGARAYSKFEELIESCFSSIGLIIKKKTKLPVISGFIELLKSHSLKELSKDNTNYDIVNSCLKLMYILGQKYLDD